MDYSGINAKIKAMRGNLLKRADYDLLSRADSVESVARMLAEVSTYKNVMSRTVGVEVHRDLIEQTIILSLSEEFSRIYHFISDFNIRKFMNAFFLSFELGIIKTLLCMVFDERNISYTAPELKMLIGSDMKIDTAALIASKNVGEFIQNLNGTELYTMLSDNVTSNSLLFEIEMQIDLYYYMNLWKKQKFLDTKNRRIMEKIIGTEIDLRNIIIVERLKRYYTINDSRIFAYMIPVSYKLNRGQLMRMTACRTTDELGREIDTSPYKKVFERSTDFERSFKNEMTKLYNRAVLIYPRSLAYTTGYVFAKQMELSNIISLLEGIRYKLNVKEIFSYLYFPLEKEALNG
ncbi:MAG: V-type ATPase subunit [Clostridiales bacterium]|jgi:V/A-type H+-transporting ATPase subunit C|nr:V-type ATPase subunit [Clostridiales bacterium]